MDPQSTHTLQNDPAESRLHQTNCKFISVDQLESIIRASLKRMPEIVFDLAHTQWPPPLPTVHIAIIRAAARPPAVQAVQAAQMRDSIANKWLNERRTQIFAHRDSIYCG